MIPMSRIIQERRELADFLKSNDGVFVLFYASWCPFSLGFLPIYEKHAAGREQHFVRITLNGHEDVFIEHGIEVYPTVIFFKGGKIHKRLDGKHLAGLKEKQLTELIDSCGIKRD
jgi:thioredoxin-like negative regulator of GroEL